MVSQDFLQTGSASRTRRNRNVPVEPPVRCHRVQVRLNVQCVAIPDGVTGHFLSRRAKQEWGTVGGPVCYPGASLFPAVAQREARFMQRRKGKTAGGTPALQEFPRAGKGFQRDWSWVGRSDEPEQKTAGGTHFVPRGRSTQSSGGTA